MRSASWRCTITIALVTARLEQVSRHRVASFHAQLRENVYPSRDLLRPGQNRAKDHREDYP